MKRRMSNATRLGLFLLVTVGSGAQAPGQDPSAGGQWESVLTWPGGAIHMIVLKNGKVLAFDQPLDDTKPTPCWLFDPVTETITAEFDGPGGEGIPLRHCRSLRLQSRERGLSDCEIEHVNRATAIHVEALAPSGESGLRAGQARLEQVIVE